MIFPVSRSKHKILEYIYNIPGCGIAEVLKATKTSAGSGYVYIGSLLKSGVISEQTIGSKPTLRRLRPSFGESGAALFALLEIDRRLDFYAKHSYIWPAMAHFERETKGLLDVALIFGSFARGGETRESDLDILVICGRKSRRKVAAIQERAFVLLKNRVSLRTMERGNFISLLRKKDAFAEQVAKEHVVIVNASGWIGILAETSEG